MLPCTFVHLPLFLMIPVCVCGGGGGGKKSQMSAYLSQEVEVVGG